MDLGPPSEGADGLHRQRAPTLEVGGASGIGRDGGDGDEGFEKLFEAAPLPLGEREETGPL
jgi:hypothetical protein